MSFPYLCTSEAQSQTPISSKSEETGNNESSSSYLLAKGHDFSPTQLKMPNWASKELKTEIELEFVFNADQVKKQLSNIESTNLEAEEGQNAKKNESFCSCFSGSKQNEAKPSIAAKKIVKPNTILIEESFGSSSSSSSCSCESETLKIKGLGLKEGIFSFTTNPNVEIEQNIQFSSSCLNFGKEEAVKSYPIGLQFEAVDILKQVEDQAKGAGQNLDVEDRLFLRVKILEILDMKQESECSISRAVLRDVIFDQNEPIGNLDAIRMCFGILCRIILC